MLKLLIPLSHKTSKVSNMKTNYFLKKINLSNYLILKAIAEVHDF